MVRSDDKNDGWLGASIYQQHFGDNKIYAPPPIDLAAERTHGSFVRQQILAGKINAAHDISDGGLAVAIAEMAMKSGLGASIDDPQTRVISMPGHSAKIRHVLLSALLMTPL